MSRPTSRAATSSSPPTASRTALEAQLEEAIAKRFGFDVPVIVRTAAAMGRTIRPAIPFPQAAKDEPNRLMLLLSKAAARRRRREADPGARAGRRAGQARRRRALVPFPEGAGTSKLTPALIDKAIGSPATGRNYRTVMTLQEMLNA